MPSQDNMGDVGVKPTQGFIQLAQATVKFAISYYAGLQVAEASDELSFDLDFNTSFLDVSTSSKISPDSLEIVRHALELTTEFETTGSIECSDEAVSLLDALIETTAEDAPDRHLLLFFLARILCRRVEVQASNTPSETLVKLHNALMRSFILLRQAIHTSSSNLGVKFSYFRQLGHTGSLWSTLINIGWKDKESQILELLEAQRNDAMQLNHSGIVLAILMASTLSTAYGGTGDTRYRKEGRELYRRLISSLKDALPIEVLAEVPRGNFLQQLAALNFMSEGFIPFVVQFVGLTMQRLVEVPLSAVIGRRAAAAAVDSGFTNKGAEWLEQCLMVVWSQTRIRAVAPQDALRIEATSDADPEGRVRQVMLAFLGVCMDTDLALDGQASVPHPERFAFRLVEEWLKLLKAARADPRLDDLFKPRPFAQLVAAARKTPVVMLNLWGTQCDALVLPSDSATTFERIQLDLSEDLAGKLEKNLRGGLDALGLRVRGDEVPEEIRGAKSDASTSIERVLAILWEKVVQPIFRKLKLTVIEDLNQDPPRLTWCLTGPTSFFPLHAAGLYTDDKAGTKAYEFVATSYTPTLSILADANDALAQKLEDPFAGVLAVSQPDTLGQKEIPNTVDEVKALLAAVEESDPSVPQQWLNSTNATKAAVLKGMETSSWVHLACHARQYPLNASESAFMLAGGETLSLADIGMRTAAGGELAFLSACQTAAGDADLSLEGVHLAAGMLVAGYCSVIATAWAVHDRDARDVAEAFYRRLLASGRVDRAGAALALHHAVRELRERVRLHDFVRWAPFMHFGV